MRKIILIAAALLSVAAAYAGTGSAEMYPAGITVSAYHPVLNILYKPGSAGPVYGGAVAVQMNQNFGAMPTTITTSPGVVSAKIMLGGTTAQPVDPANIAIENYSVTINAVTLSSADVLVITWGQTIYGGLYGPGLPGAYGFETFEQRPGSGGFARIDKQPVLFVSNISLNKSCSAASVKAGDTFTYTVYYQNSDTAYPMSGLMVWDTLPPGVMFIGSVPPPASNTGSCYSWNIGTISSNSFSAISITARAKPGIISYGLKSINAVSVSALSPISGNNFMSNYCTTDVLGVILQSSITAAPDVAMPDSHITVYMNVTNAGNLQSGTITPSLAIKSLGGSAVYATGPIPPVLNLLNANSSAVFTWVYTAAGAGSVSFTGSAAALENGSTVLSAAADSNIISIVNPTATSTPDIVPTATETAIVTPVVTPDKTPAVEGKASLDKNYINTGKGEKVTIKYRVEKDGETSIRVFNLNGEVVRNFYNFRLGAGSYNAYWDGTNDAGKKVGKGMYFVVVKQPGGQTTKKLLVIK